ncbi:MAG TPA: type II toxin-antitoxin system VapC family toxin [Candidatus Binatia bacterium]
MTTGFVADASVAIAWVHPGQATAESDALLQAVEKGARVRAPALWPLETANALLVLTRRGKLTEGDRRLALSALSGLQVELDHEMAALAYGKLSDLARKYRLSVYDASYLELALRNELPLACKDGPLRDAAKRCRVRLAM